MSATAQRTRPQATAAAMPSPITLRLRPVLDLTPDQLLELSSLNDGLRFELTAEGELLVMAPLGGDSGISEMRLGTQLTVWALGDGAGVTFSPSAAFTLPNGSTRSADASWVAQARWDALKPEQRRKIPSICPDFVIELKSPSDRVSALQRKMGEWIANGVRLGWLIDPDAKRVYVYRPDAPMQQLDAPTTVAGDPVLPGFVLDLSMVWDFPRSNAQ